MPVWVKKECRRPLDHPPQPSGLLIWLSAMPLLSTVSLKVDS